MAQPQYNQTKPNNQYLTAPASTPTRTAQQYLGAFSTYSGAVTDPAAIENQNMYDSRAGYEQLFGMGRFLAEYTKMVLDMAANYMISLMQSVYGNNQTNRNNSQLCPAFAKSPASGLENSIIKYTPQKTVQSTGKK